MREKDINAEETMSVIDQSVIEVKQLPIIEQRLREIQSVFEAGLAQAQAMSATEENLAAIKSARASLRRQFDELENRRKAVKEQINRPYDAFNVIYKDTILDTYQKAEGEFKQKIDEIDGMRRKRIVDEARRFFEDYAKSIEIDDLITFEDLNLHITLSSSDAALTKEITEACNRVLNDKRAAMEMENGAEILYEYKTCHDLAVACESVRRRHEAIKASNDAAAQKQATEKPQTHEEDIKPPEPVYECNFLIKATIPQLTALKRWLKENGIEIINKNPPKK